MREKRSSQALPMRKTEVPQLGHTPLMAGFPFLSVTFWGSFISTLVLHFTQYACGIFFSSETPLRNIVVFSTHLVPQGLPFDPVEIS